jgi:hypothetical protein
MMSTNAMIARLGSSDICVVSVCRPCPVRDSFSAVPSFVMLSKGPPYVVYSIERWECEKSVTVG